MSIDLDYNNIYVIIGENGSGKSTFINAILGLIKPNIGYIQIQSKTKDEKPKIGFCPQYNMLMNNLTVEEHLIFYYTLKTGCGFKDTNTEISTFIYFKLDL